MDWQATLATAPTTSRHAARYPCWAVAPLDASTKHAWLGILNFYRSRIPQGLNEALEEELVVMALEDCPPQLPQYGLIGSRPPSRVGSIWRGPDACADSVLVGANSSQVADGRGLPILRDPFVGSWKNALVCESVHKRWFFDRARSHLADLRRKRTAIAECPEQLATDKQDWGPGLSTGDQIVWTHPLRGLPEPTPKAIRKLEDNKCLAGMRNAHRAVARILGWLVVGDKLRQITKGFFAEFPEALAKCLGSTSGDPELRTQVLSEDTLDGFRNRLSSAFGDCSTAAVNAGDCDTKIRADLMGAIAAEASDLGISAVDWLKTGATAGVFPSTSAADSIFPKDSEPSQEGDLADTLARTEEEFTNYKGIDQDQDAVKELLGFRDNGDLQSHEDLSSCFKKLGGTVVLSRFGLVIRTRNGKTKKRIILDLKESMIFASSGRTNGVVLPRLTDHILCLLEELDIIYDDGAIEVDDLPELIEDDDDDDDDDDDVDDDDDDDDEDSFNVEQFILDFCEAFRQVPLRPDERRYFVGKIKQIILSYRRAAQGSRNGPLAWASVVSFLVHMVQAIFRTSCLAPRNMQAATKIERRKESGMKGADLRR